MGDYHFYSASPRSIPKDVRSIMVDNVINYFQVTFVQYHIISIWQQVNYVKIFGDFCLLQAYFWSICSLFYSIPCYFCSILDHFCPNSDQLWYILGQLWLIPGELWSFSGHYCSNSGYYLSISCEFWSISSLF